MMEEVEEKGWEKVRMRTKGAKSIGTKGGTKTCFANQTIYFKAHLSGDHLNNNLNNKQKSHK